MSSARARYVAALLTMVVLTVTIAGCGSDEPTTTPSATTNTIRSTGPLVRATKVAQFENTLTGLVSSKDGRHLLVSDRLGAIWSLETSATGPADAAPKLNPRPALDLTTRVSATPGERGFFGMTLSPDGRSLVVDYTATDGTITVEQYPYQPGTPLDASKGRTLMALHDPYSWHHGGGLAFGRNGDLLVGIGDLEFRQIDPPGAQDPNLMIGGILRIPARVVDDPTVTSDPKPSDLIARGLRNPWRISVDDRTGDLWIGDVGLSTYEEINTIPQAKLGGRTVTNFGWPYREGPIKQQTGAPAGAKFVAPVLARHHADDVCGVVAGYWYRGSDIPALKGRFVHGDLCGRDLRALTVTSDGKVDGDVKVADLPENIVSLGQTSSGQLYALGSTGGLYRLDPASSSAKPSSQTPHSQETTTTVPRSSPDCGGGVVQAVSPLSNMGSMTGEELTPALDTALANLARIVPNLPDYLHDDGVIVERAIEEIARRLAATDGDKAAALEPMRHDLEAGRGAFAGFPDAMATIVDSECG